MSKTKSLAAVLLLIAVLFAQVGTAFAAPATQNETPITGTIVALEKETDANGVTTVLVTIKNETTGATQTYRISLDTAVSLGLASVDPVTNEVTLDLTKVNQTITLDPGTVLPDQEEEQPFNPVAALLASFFGVDASVINQYHEDGYGFGVIAQALWMSKSLSETGAGDATLAGCILDAKRNGTYDTCFSFGDDPVPTNWGQFKKAILDNKQKHNLGVIVSGHADPNDTSAGWQDHGNGKDKKKNKGHGNGNGNQP